MNEKLIKLSQVIFPDLTDEDTIESLEALFPERGLKEGAKVTRMAPSPTGSMHIGNLYGALSDERIAHTSTDDGVFILRIEDTDDKREVPGAVEAIIKYMGAFGIEFDEGATADGDKGAYGPYRQRQRAKYYHIVARKLLLDGRAYPCFCSEDELKEAHEAQEAAVYIRGLARSLVVDRYHVSAKLCDYSRYVHKLTGLIHKLNAKVTGPSRGEKSSLDNS